MVTGGRSRPAPRGPGGGRPRWRRGRAAADGDHRGLRCGQVVFAKTWAPVEEVTLGGRWGESRISLIRKSPPGAERKLHSSPSGGHSPDASPRKPVVLLQVMPAQVVKRTRILMLSSSWGWSRRHRRALQQGQPRCRAGRCRRGDARCVPTTMTCFSRAGRGLRRQGVPSCAR